MRVYRKWIHVDSFDFDGDEWRVIGSAIRKVYPDVKVVKFVEWLARRGYVDVEFPDGRRETVGLWKHVTRGKRKGYWIKFEPEIMETIKKLEERGA